jgi:hypothetical protein
MLSKEQNKVIIVPATLFAGISPPAASDGLFFLITGKNGVRMATEKLLYPGRSCFAQGYAG